MYDLEKQRENERSLKISKKGKAMTQLRIKVTKATANQNGFDVVVEESFISECDKFGENAESHSRTLRRYRDNLNLTYRFLLLQRGF